VERWDREPLADERREDRCVEEPLDRAEEWCPGDLRRLDELRLFAIFTSLYQTHAVGSGLAYRRP
jgi:hypothetical protein